MKKKLLMLALFLVGASVWAQTAHVTVSDDYNKNGRKEDLRISGTEQGYDWVNLGLSVKWATCNLGATVPEEYGNYYAWGETITKPRYYEDNYFDTNDNGFSYKKYRHWGAKSIIEPSDDAATQNWGESWRLPTKAEWNELMTMCNWTWSTQNGINGYLVTAPNGNSIFLPAAGYWRGSWMMTVGTEGFYWSSVIDENFSHDAYDLHFTSSDLYLLTNYRYYGRSVRPVCDVSSSNSVILTLYAEGSNVANEYICSIGQDITITAEESLSGSRFIRWSDGATAPTRTITMNDNISLTACYQTNFTLNVYDDCSIGNVPTNVQIVDLGLRVSWANMNIGAAAPEAYGDYYAWGETVPKTIFNWASYLWIAPNQSSANQINKYTYPDGQTSACWYNNGVFIGDNETVLVPSDDAATRAWNETWRMPTEADWQELKDSCTWTWTSMNGVNGFQVSAINGNSIFLPAAGAKTNTDFYIGTYGYYWSSSLRKEDSKTAKDIVIAADYADIDYNSRYVGSSVRPVYAITKNTQSIACVLSVFSNVGNNPYILSCPRGSNIEVYAVAVLQGNRFSHWSDGSLDNPRTIILTGDASLTAIYGPEIVTDVVEITAAPNVRKELIHGQMYITRGGNTYTVLGTKVK